jgi:hypothetical protein
VSFEIVSLDEEVCIKVEDASVSKILTTANDKPPTNGEVEGLDYMEGIVSFQELDDELIGIILPVQYARTWLGGEIVQGDPDQTMALRTKFGWTLLGPVVSEEDGDNLMNCCVVEEGGLEDLRDDINHMFRWDFLPRPGEETRPEVKHPSREDEYAMKQIQESIKFDEVTGHYSCGLPWVNGRAAAAENLDAKTSKWNAIDKLQKMGKHMEQDQEMKTAVFALVKGIVDDGHAKVVGNHEVYNH